MMMHLIVGLGQRIYIVFKSWQPYLDLCKNEEEEEEIIAQFFSCHLVIIHGMQGQEYGTLNEMSGWLRRRKGKETRKFPTALSPALTSPPISLDIPTWLPTATPVSIWPKLSPPSPQHSRRPFSPHLLPMCLLVAQARIGVTSSTLFIIHFHICHLTSLTNFSFEIFFASMCSSFFFSKPMALALAWSFCL